MSNLFEVQRSFRELASKLAALKEFQADDDEAVERINRAEQRARYGAELAARAARALSKS
jgi:hypothetical protein